MAREAHAPAPRRLARDPRSAEEVFEDHLALRLAGRVEEDIERNYAEDIVLVSSAGVEHGHDGVRACARRLREALPGAEYRYERRLVNGEVAFLEWSGRSPSGARTEDGVDTFVIRDGRIVAKTVHYTVRK